MTGQIYFISAPECKRIKIGWSNCLESRFDALATASPVALKLLFALEAEHTLEKCVHFHFRKDRVKNEWFHSSWRLRQFIKSLRNGAPLHSLLNADDLKGKRIFRIRKSAQSEAERALRSYLLSTTSPLISNLH